MIGNNLRLKITKKAFLNLILAVVIILNTGYYRSTVTGSYVPFILLIMSAFWLLLSRSDENAHIVKSSSIFFILLGTVLSAVVNISNANILSGGRVFILVACIWIILSRSDKTELLKAVVLLVKAIAVITIVMTIIKYFTDTLPFPTIKGAGGVYYDTYIYTAKANVQRVYGVFWEPGVFASVISISMIVDYFILRREFTIYNSLSYIVAMLMTKSTAGILIMFIILFGILWGKIVKKESIFTHTVFIIIVLLLMLFFEDIAIRLAESSPDIFGKLIEKNSDSKTTRILCPLINLDIFFERPLFGYGFTDAATEFSKLMGKMTHEVTSQTSTSTQILSCIGIGGIFYTVALVAPLFDRRKLSKNTFVEKVTIVVAMLFIVNKEPQIFFALTWMIIMLFGSKDKEEIVQENIGTRHGL